MNEAGGFYVRVGELTRQLHDALRQLGYDKQIEDSLSRLPDARARLSFIARLTGDAAEKVLDTVDAAQARQVELRSRAETLASRLDAGEGVAARDMRDFALAVRDETTEMGAALTTIMMAQDFHDLTGQTVRKVVDIAAQLESSLVELLLEVAPPECQHGALDGPVADASQRTDVVANQAQVDALLESLGF